MFLKDCKYELDNDEGVFAELSSVIPKEIHFHCLSRILDANTFDLIYLYLYGLLSFSCSSIYKQNESL